VLDFGISKRLDDDLEAGLTSSGAVMGTTHYLSPEQVAGLPLDVRSDQYSLGVILYEALTGRRPHEGTSMFAVMQSIGAGRFPQPRLVRPEIPVALEAVILKAMSARPADRFESVHELGASLMAFASPKRRIMWSDYYERGRPPVTPAPGSYARIPLPAVCAEGGTVALDLKKDSTPLTPTQTGARASERRESTPAWKDTRSEPRPVPVLGTEEYLRTNPGHRTGARRAIALLALVAGGVTAYAFLVEPRWLDWLPAGRRGGADPRGPAVERARPDDLARAAGPAAPARTAPTPSERLPARSGVPTTPSPVRPVTPVAASSTGSRAAAPGAGSAPGASSEKATARVQEPPTTAPVSAGRATPVTAGRGRVAPRPLGRTASASARKRAADLEGERALGSLFPGTRAPGPEARPGPAAAVSRVPPAVARPATSSEAIISPPTPAAPAPTSPAPVTSPPVLQPSPRPTINPGGAPILE
jgi:eukaryotic-like serine/threonine-protein kinase